jgi:hypothetical protein
MRSNRRNFRVLHEGCPAPKRAKTAPPSMARTMEPRHTSILAGGAASDNHDDWCCLHDMAAHGLFGLGDEVEPGSVLHLSPLGNAIATELRRHKADGGTFAGFRPSSGSLADAASALAATLSRAAESPAATSTRPTPA